MRPASIVATYLVVSFIWIGVTDPLIEAFALSPRATVVIGIAKGYAFVVVSGALLYLLIRRYVSTLEANRRQLAERIDELTVSAMSREEAEDRLRDALGRAGEATWEFDFSTRTIRLSPELWTVLGMPDLPRTLDEKQWTDLIHPDDVEKIDQQSAELLAGKINQYETVFRVHKPGGGWRWFESKGGIDRRQGRGRYVSLGTVRDVTELRQRDQELGTTNKALHALVAANRVIVAAKSRSQLLGEVCQSLVNELSLKLVWIGEAMHDEARSVRPVARAGEAAGVLDDVQITWGDTPNGQGLVGRAIRGGALQYADDAARDPRLEPWREVYSQTGMASAAAIPIREQGIVWGVLMAHGLDIDSLGTHERVILENLGDDIGYALAALAARESAVAAEKERGAAMSQVREGTLNAVRALASAVEARDPYTAGHQARVAALAVRIGARLGLTLFELEGLQLGGILHDIGKIGVPSEILSKPGRLSPSQLALVREHPRIGREIVQSLVFPWPIADMIGLHHERLDGTGYPDGLRGDAICREAKIIAVADVAESMLSHRPYRPALSPQFAIKELTDGKGTKYWPEAVDACLALMQAPDFSIQLGGGLGPMPARAAAAP